jgi:hypothetical protein
LRFSEAKDFSTAPLWFYLHSKLTRVRNFFQVAVVKLIAVFLGFQQVLAQFLFVALDDEFEFIQAA